MRVTSAIYPIPLASYRVKPRDFYAMYPFLEVQDFQEGESNRTLGCLTPTPGFREGDPSIEVANSHFGLSAE
jgi:hypothetical protein